VERVTVRSVVFSADGAERFDDPAAAVDADGETWVHVEAATPAELATLRERFDVHALAIEDVQEGRTRPKTEVYDGHTFVLLKTVRLARGDVEFQKEVATTPIGLFLGPDWLVTVSPEPLDVVDVAATQWLASPDRIARRGTDFLAYRIMDAVVDDYFELLDELEDDIEAIEERVLDEPDPRMLEALNDVRRDLLAFRKVAWPSREATASLSRGDVPGVTEANEKYFRDVHDHLVQVVDFTETYRDLSGGTRDIYLNAVSQSTNEVMKTLTIVATIFIPLTFVAGIYGMNFADTPFAMPELYWTYGYPATMLGMGVVAALMLVHFRRQDWL